MRVNQIFLSIQGEGLYCGVPMIFLRLQGCNLAEAYGGCRWCDTPYAQSVEGGEEVRVEDILKRLSTYSSKRVCLTGGEPLWQPKVGELLAALRSRGYWIEVETNGSISVAKYLDTVDSWVVDIKCPSSGMEQYTCWANLAILRESDQVKFVVHDAGDVVYAQKVLRTLNTRAHILFSPVYGDQEWLMTVAEQVKQIPQARLSVQLHKFIWGEDKYEGGGASFRRIGLGDSSCYGQEARL